MTEDLFRIEVERMHRLRASLAELDAAERAAFVRDLIESGAGSADDWLLTARDAQLPPLGDWSVWLFLGGRGCGKTHALSCAVHTAVRAGIGRIHFVGPTTSDLYDVNIFGPAGIMKTTGRGPLPRWIPSKRRIEWPNGATCIFYSAEEPESLRGPQCSLCLIDEIGRMRQQAEVFDQANMGLRLGPAPRMLIATTPRPTPFIKKLVNQDHVTITTGSTFDNEAHLSPAFLKRIKELYEGTRLGRQELNGALLLDPANALFLDSWIPRDAVPEETIEQASVGVDPSGGGDEVGIVVAALLTDGRLAVLADRSLSAASPGQWGDVVVKAHDEFKCDDCVVELNYGGSMASDVVKQAADRAHQTGKRDSPYIRIKEVTASRGKVMRAEPISLMYEKARVVHRPGLAELENEMLSFSRDWDSKVDGSPNRLDAAVWCSPACQKSSSIFRSPNDPPPHPNTRTTLGKLPPTLHRRRRLLANYLIIFWERRSHTARANYFREVRDRKLAEFSSIKPPKSTTILAGIARSPGLDR
jgi:phage terminase large subunit-like protein